MKSQTSKLILFLFVISSMSLYADKTQGLDIKLISENSSITGGKPFTVGVHIHHHEGYHTYWKNPGVVGIPTSIDWGLPEGFTAEPIQWPYPEISSMAGHPCHGYERDVTLLIQITPPANLMQKDVTLKATITWMCCAKNCFPGNKQVSLHLPVTAEPNENLGNVKLFAKAREELPKKNGPWQISIQSQSDQEIIQLSLSSKEENAIPPEYVFSEDGQISSNKKQQFVKKEDGSYMLKIARSRLSPKSPKKMLGVIKVGKKHFSFDVNYKNKD